MANNYDAIEKMIYEEGLKIEAIELYAELDVMLVILNTKAVLHQKISDYKKLKSSDKNALMQYQLIANGTGIHWPILDEDLSLKGFLRDELKSIVTNKKAPAIGN